MLSSLLYEDQFSIPIELICLEIGYLLSTIAFESICLMKFGATPGKLIFKLRVLRCHNMNIAEDGTVTVNPGHLLNYVGALTRSSFKSLMSTFLFPAIIVALVTSHQRQTSYDMAANSLVVELEPRQQQPPTPTPAPPPPVAQE